MSATYNPLLSITLVHEYYAGATCPIALSPDTATHRIFRHHNILFRTQGPNHWQVLAEDDFSVADLAEDTHFRFDLRVLDRIVYYVSQHTDSLQAVEIDVAAAGRMFNIHIPASERYFEYICIPRYTGANVPVKMREERERIHIKATGRVSLPGVSVALRFVSEEKIKLSRLNGLNMQLWEVREAGERLISKEIPHPLPDHYSLLSSKDTITSLFYY
jgi:hypothetical protein